MNLKKAWKIELLGYVILLSRNFSFMQLKDRNNDKLKSSSINQEE